MSARFHGFVRISPCNEILFDLEGKYQVCAYLTSWSDSHLSRMFRHWMRHCSTMKSSQSGCAATLSSMAKGKDRPFDEHFDYLLELPNHGVLHANQVLFIFVMLLSPFQTKPAINLKTQTLKSGFANGFPSAQYSRKRSTCGSSSRLGGPLSLIEAVGRYNKLLT